jgi:hypothetical protein
MKTTNEYQRHIVGYGSIPKAVLAAIAVSFAAMHHGDKALDSDSPSEVVTGWLMQEWQTLYEQGIVPQKPR